MVIDAGFPTVASGPKSTFMVEMTTAIGIAPAIDTKTTGLYNRCGLWCFCTSGTTWVFIFALNH